MTPRRQHKPTTHIKTDTIMLNKKIEEALNAQIAFVSAYLPKMMTDEEIKAEILALSDKSVPSVMKHFKANFAGKCDMRRVQEVLNSL